MIAAWRKFVALKIGLTYEDELQMAAYLRRLEDEGAGTSMVAEQVRFGIALARLRRELWLSMP